MGEVAPKTTTPKTPSNSTKKPNNNTPSSEINISLIKANQYQPRTTFDEKKLKELSDSIKTVSYTHLTLPTIRSV